MKSEVMEKIHVHVVHPEHVMDRLNALAQAVSRRIDPELNCEPEKYYEAVTGQVGEDLMKDPELRRIAAFMIADLMLGGKAFLTPVMNPLRLKDKLDKGDDVSDEFRMITEALLERLIPGVGEYLHYYS